MVYWIAPVFAAYFSNDSYQSCKQDIAHEDRISENVSYVTRPIRLRMELFNIFRIFDAMD